MSGRPKPTALKLINGNPGGKPLPENEPKPRPIAPQSPKDIGKLARQAWKAIAPKLERLGLLTELDGEALSDLCEIRARIIQIREMINSEGFTLLEAIPRPDPDGGVRWEFKPNQLTVMERMYYEAFQKYAAKFGLSPRDRVGLSVGPKGDDGEELF